MLLRKDPDPLELSDRIHRDSYEPVYVQLANILRRRIVEGAAAGRGTAPFRSGGCAKATTSVP